MTATLYANSHRNGTRCAYACSRCDAAAAAGRPSPCTPAQPLIPLATEKQVSFLRQLATERELGISADDMAARAAKITKGEASTWIKAALDKPRKAPQAPQAAPAPEATTEAAAAVPAGDDLVPRAERTNRVPLRTAVAPGRYAVSVPGDTNDVSFFKLDHGKGRWTGHIFLTQYASDAEYPVRGARQDTVMALIAADAEAAGLRYGQLIGSCCRCGRTLTDDASRAAGIGPECAKKGW